jgi:hypothetical protein
VQTFARASNGVCTATASGGFATSGIADGDLRLLSSNVARVEYDSTGVLGELIEAQGINLLPRFDALTNALWSDVGTPTVTDGATDPFGATTGDTVTDDDPAAFEGRSQPIAVSAGAATYAYCLVKAGTLAKPRISLDGTVATLTGISSTTWSIIGVLDASASGTSISFQVTNGTATSDTGSIIWGGCDAKALTYRTSIVPTAGSTATRAAESAYFTFASTEVQCVASTVEVPAGLNATNVRIIGDAQGATKSFTGYASGSGTTPVPLHSFQSVGATKDLSSSNNITLGASNRLVVWAIPSTTIGAIVNGTETTSSSGVQAAADGITKFYPGSYAGGAGFESNSIHSRIQLDPVSTRCR